MATPAFIEGIKCWVKVSSNIVCFMNDWVKQFPVQLGNAWDAERLACGSALVKVMYVCIICNRPWSTSSYSCNLVRLAAQFMDELSMAASRIV